MGKGRRDLEKTPENRSKKKVVEEVPNSESESSWSSMTSLMLISSPHQEKVDKKPKREASTHVTGTTTTLTAMMELLKRVENKVDRVEERLRLLEESCSTIREIVEKIGARIVKWRSWVRYVCEKSFME